jgi:hypothetical protein
VVARALVSGDVVIGLLITPVGEDDGAKLLWGEISRERSEHSSENINKQIGLTGQDPNVLVSGLVNFPPGRVVIPSTTMTYEPVCHSIIHR